MKNLLFMFLVPILLWLWVQSYASTSMVSKTIDGKATRIITTVLDWNHYVISSVSETAKPLKDLVSQVWWIAWINGSYFCPNDYVACGGVSYTYSYRKFLDYTDNDIEWQNNKTIFGISYSGTPIIKTKQINTLTNIAFWISNFPAILIDWVNSLDFEWLTQKNIAIWTKAFICSNKGGTIIKMGFVYNISLDDMPSYLLTNLQCWNALNLDWWGSLAMKYGTGYLRQGRNIMDAFVVVTSWVWNRLMSWNNNTGIVLYTWYIASPYSWLSREEYKHQQTITRYNEIRENWDYVKIVRGWIVTMKNYTCTIWDIKCAISKWVHLQLFNILTTH